MRDSHPATKAGQFIDSVIGDLVGLVGAGVEWIGLDDLVLDLGLDRLALTLGDAAKKVPAALNKVPDAVKKVPAALKKAPDAAKELPDTQVARGV